MVDEHSRAEIGGKEKINGLNQLHNETQAEKGGEISDILNTLR